MVTWPISEKEPPRTGLLIGMSCVVRVMKAAIREPVASVPISESIRITTTTTPLITPMPRPMTRASATAGTTPHPLTRKCAAATPVSDMT